MQWKRTLQLVDVHCCGEIGRVVTGGVLNIPGDTVAEKLAHINTVDDSLRRFLCSEPRSGPAGSIVLLTPTTDKDADVGMIVLQPDQAHAMSGSNAMCAVTALLETGMVEMQEPTSIVTLDTASGLVRATATCENGKVTKISLDMPQAFLFKENLSLQTEQWGDISLNVCYGGIFYGLVDVTQVGLTITPENARELAVGGVSILQQLNNQYDTIQHPDVPEINGVAYVMFYAQENDGTVRTCTTMRPGRVDRSPCGTGSTAYLAMQCHAGNIKVGDAITTRSIIGSEFLIEAMDIKTVGDYKTVNARVSGQAWIYGISQIGLDATDPFPYGFTLSDTWGQ